MEQEVTVSLKEVITIFGLILSLLAGVSAFFLSLMVKQFEEVKHDMVEVKVKLAEVRQKVFS